jgi:hypothetical protein
VDGVEGGELAEGPTVFPVPVLFAGPEDVACFLFLLFWIQAFKYNYIKPSRYNLVKTPIQHTITTSKSQRSNFQVNYTFKNIFL